MVVDGGGGSVCCYYGGGGRGGVSFCVRCLLSCRLEESHERVCAGCYRVKLRVPTAPASQLRNSSFSCVGALLQRRRQARGCCCCSTLAMAMIPRTTRIAIEIFDATCTDNLVGYDAFLSHALLPAGLSYEAADALWHGLERRGHELRRPEIIAGAAKFADEFERVHRFLYQQRMATTTSDVASPSDLLLGDVAST